MLLSRLVHESTYKTHTIHDIVDCDNIYELPTWLSTLNFLKTLSIENCPALLELPDGLHSLPNLEYLKIEGCLELCTRYQPEVGEDWPKISHIKQVTIVSLEPKNESVKNLKMKTAC